MDPFLEYQRSLLLTFFVCFGIAITLAALLPYLVRNAEAWKTRLLNALLPEPSESSAPFGEQALLPLHFQPDCPHCQRPMAERRTRILRNGGALLWGCSAFPRCRGTRVEMRGRAVY
jgi:hypothetical protein